MDDTRQLKIWREGSEERDGHMHASMHVCAYAVFQGAPENLEYVCYWTLLGVPLPWYLPYIAHEEIRQRSIAVDKETFMYASYVPNLLNLFSSSGRPRLEYGD